MTIQNLEWLYAVADHPSIDSSLTTHLHSPPLSTYSEWIFGDHIQQHGPRCYPCILNITIHVGLNNEITLDLTIISSHVAFRGLKTYFRFMTVDQRRT